MAADHSGIGFEDNDQRVSADHFCPVCREVVNNEHVVFWCCNHSFCQSCDNQLVGTAIGAGAETGDNVPCPCCREPRRVRDTVSLARAVSAAPEFSTGAAGSTELCKNMQTLKKLPNFAVLCSPNLRDIAKPWVEAFLSHRRCGESNLMQAFDVDSWSVLNDSVAGVMAKGTVKQHWFTSGRHTLVEQADHVTHMGCLFDIMCHGLEVGTSEKQCGRRTEEMVQGVFMHKHGARRLARNYMTYWMFPEGFVVSVLLQCRAADPPARRTCLPDQ